MTELVCAVELGGSNSQRREQPFALEEPGLTGGPPHGSTERRARTHCPW
jgi:hypothetical protein